MPFQELEPRNSGPFTNNGTAKSNNAKCNENFAELFKTMMVCHVTPGGTARAFFAPPVGRRLVSAERKVETPITSELGTVTAALKKAGTRLLSTATVDAKAFTTEYVNATLSGNGESADLTIADGQLVTLEVVSSNGDALGGPVIFRLTWAPQT